MPALLADVSRHTSLAHPPSVFPPPSVWPDQTFQFSVKPRPPPLQCPPVPPRDHLAGKDAEGLAVLAPVDSVVVSALEDSFGNFMGRGPRIPPRFWRRNIPVPPMHDVGSPGLQVYTPPVEFSPFPTVRHSSVTLHCEVQVRRFPNHVFRPIHLVSRGTLKGCGKAEGGVPSW